jgi:hypothetical protein
MRRVITSPPNFATGFGRKTALDVI